MAAISLSHASAAINWRIIFATGVSLRVARRRIGAEKLLQEILSICVADAEQQKDQEKRRASGTKSNHELDHSENIEEIPFSPSFMSAERRDINKNLARIKTRDNFSRAMNCSLIAGRVDN